MIPIKSTGRTLTEMQELEAMAAELLKTARKLPPGPVRHDLFKEIGKFRALHCTEGEGEMIGLDQRVNSSQG